MMNRILVVEDENLILRSLTASLRHDGADVTAVTNGMEALSEIRRLSYNICFLDIHLPDANGLDLIKIFREVSPATKIIIMTASEIDSDLLRDILSHAWCFLPKPFELEDVRLLVRRSLMNDRDIAHETSPTL